MPVVLAGAIGDMSIQNVPDYATVDQHEAAVGIAVGLAE
jgi:hypothetical protein